MKYWKVEIADHTVSDRNCLTLDELERHANTMWERQTRDYYNEGANLEVTVRENMETCGKYRIRPRVMRDVFLRRHECRNFGYRNSIPLGVAPAAMQRLAHPDGKVADARAFKKPQITMGIHSIRKH